MIAVSNTTPLRYLIAIGQERVLANLFDKVLVPHAVHEELTDPRTPEFVRGRVLSRPAWYEVRTVSENQTIPVPVLLHRGELQAILLAEEVKPDILLIDDQAGRKIALSRNIPLSGTLGVLERADAVGLVDGFPEVLDSLAESGFFVAEPLKQRMLKRHIDRREKK
ncbi:MAG: hypothetical protein WCC03_21915 [Candidatus Acidiferrales bacterium]